MPVTALILAITAAVLIGSAGTCRALDVIPDTGQTLSHTETFGEDADYAGIPQSYTKLGHNGAEMPDDAQASDGWIMTRDNVTGLIWEVKTRDGSIHHWEDTYTWCDTDYATNGGFPGTCSDGGDTMDFIQALNDDAFGGFTDWRMPTEKELSTLLNHDRFEPAINTTFFPNTLSTSYWSSVTANKMRDHAWRVSFDDGLVSHGIFKTFAYGVRAVRSP